MNKWGANIEDPGETFKEIDVDGGGMVLFDEFAAWAMKRGNSLSDVSFFVSKLFFQYHESFFVLTTD